MSNPKATFSGLLALAEDFDVEPGRTDELYAMASFLEKINVRYGALVTNQQSQKSLCNVVAKRSGLNPVIKKWYDSLFPIAPNRPKKKQTIISDAIFEKLLPELSQRKFSFLGYGGQFPVAEVFQETPGSKSFDITKFFDSRIYKIWEKEIESTTYKDLFEGDKYKQFFGSAVLDSSHFYIYDYFVGKAYIRDSGLDPTFKWNFDGLALLCRVINNFTFLDQVEVNLFTSTPSPPGNGIGGELIEKLEVFNQYSEFKKIKFKVHLLGPKEIIDNDRYFLTDYAFIGHHGCNFRQPPRDMRNELDSDFTHFMEKKLGKKMESFFDSLKAGSVKKWLEASDEYFCSKQKRDIRGDNFWRASKGSEVKLKKKITHWMGSSNDPRFL